MSNRIATNIGHNPARQLGRRADGSFAGANALGTEHPNTLNNGAPSAKDAMGIVGETCMVSFAHRNGAQLSITAYIWNDIAQEWWFAGPVAAVYTMLLDGKAIGSMTFPEGSRIFFSGSAVAPDFFIKGAAFNNNYPVVDIAGDKI